MEELPLAGGVDADGYYQDTTNGSARVLMMRVGQCCWIRELEKCVAD